MAERIKPDFEGASLAGEFLFPYQGGLLLLMDVPDKSRLLYLKDGKITPLRFPDGKLSSDKHAELWNTPNGFYVTTFAKGVERRICRLDGLEMRALKGGAGKEFIGAGVKFSFTPGLPMLSIHREIELFGSVDVLHVVGGDVVKPIMTEGGKPFEAKDWYGVAGAPGIFAAVEQTDGAAEQEPKYYRLDGETAVASKLSAMPAFPDELAETDLVLDRYYIGNEFVVFARYADGSGYHIWLERDGKAVWLKDGDEPIKHIFTMVKWAGATIYVAGATPDGKSVVAYHLLGDKAEALSWPDNVDPAQARFEHRRGQLFLWQRFEEGARYWKLNDESFEPILTPDGKPFQLPGVTYLDSGGACFGITSGFLTNQTVYVLNENEAVPIRGANGSTLIFADSYQLMGVEQQPFVAWWVRHKDGGYLTYLRRVKADGKLASIAQADGKAMPTGASTILEAEDGLYVEMRQGDEVSFWWIHKASSD
ncbi:MAG: hypothetical protein K8I27_03875 [Planctomycetes bacterium]|nr:hypothetical protein [Planctomycetota bacterium]